MKVKRYRYWLHVPLDIAVHGEAYPAEVAARLAQLALERINHFDEGTGTDTLVYTPAEGRRLSRRR